MKSYILLRDNREWGPYTLKDLSSFGITPTDLIWIEGESTSWFHPIDIPALAGLATVTGEKRSLDRQYIKPANASVSSNAFYTTENLQPEDSSTLYFPENVSVYSTGK